MKNTLKILPLILILGFTHSLFAQFVPVTDAATLKEIKEPKLSIPKGKPTITIRDGEVYYQYDTNGTLVTFRATFDGVLTYIYVTKGDQTVLGWNQSDGAWKHEFDRKEPNKKEREELVRDVTKFQSHFKSIVLPTFDLRSFRTEDADIGDVGHAPAANWEFVGSQGYNAAEQIILKSDHNSAAVVKASDFLIAPPKSGTFRVGKKLGKLVALVEKNGAWYIPATDYYSTSVAEKTAKK